jgi:hypothetical protein
VTNGGLRAFFLHLRKVMQKRVLSFVALFVFYFTPSGAQFHATLLEGDYMPATVKINFEEHNTKHKDPPHTYFDSTRNLWHATWTQFDVYKSRKKEDVSVIYYSRSEEGKTWGTPRQINSISGNCLDGDSTVKGPMPCVGPGGEVYVTWAGSRGLAFQRSLDSGKTWQKEEKIINAIKNGWACTVDGIKTNGLPSISCDIGRSEFRGRIYICWSDEKNGVKNKDVFLIYSDDKGETWTEPILVSYRPNHKEQFKPVMKVDPHTGYLYILYFDKQNYPEGKETDIYLAMSKNGGLKFDYYKVNEHAFLFNSNYIEIFVDSTVRLRWMQPDVNSRFGLFEVQLSDSVLDDYQVKMAVGEIEAERSFSFADKIKMDYIIKQNAFITAVITKPLEPGFEKPVVKNKRVFEGKNTLVIDTKALGLKKGNYTLTLYYHGRNSFYWITGE